MQIDTHLRRSLGFFAQTARIEDEDPGYWSDAWTTKDPRRAKLES